MIEIIVTPRGGIFTHNIPRNVKAALNAEVMAKVQARLTRKGAQGSGGRGIGVKRNTITTTPGDLKLKQTSTRIAPRVTGGAWRGKNVAIVKSMAPRVINAAARRIIAEMGA